MSTQRKVLRIDELRNEVAGQIEVGGCTHDVLQLDFETHQRLEAAEKSGDMKELRAIVQKVVPSLDAETIGTFTPNIAQAVLTLAAAGLGAVERMFPNAVSPEIPTSPG